jgi:addiction module HigA family antidote
VEGKSRGDGWESEGGFPFRERTFCGCCTPGLVLREYPGDLAVTAAAAHLRVTAVTLSRVLNGKAGISAAMAIRLTAALGTRPELWMNMQSRYDLWRARQVRQPAVRRFAHVAAS